MIRVFVAVLIFYGIAYPLTRPEAEHRYSTKGIVRLAGETKAQLSLDGGLIFTTKVPYSAYFYGQDFILSHPSEDPGLSISWGLNSGKDHLYVIARKSQAKVPSQLMDKLKPVCAFGDWNLYRAAQPPLTGN
jgi:hypothetical protein